MFDFDKVVERRGTNCIKYDFAKENGKPEDILPLWVADMDFPTAPPVLDRLRQRIDHGIFGYTETKDEYFQAVKDWYQTGFGWSIEKSWLVKTPGVVFAIAAAVRAFTGEGDAVLIQPPVYHPFRKTIIANKRKVVENPLKLIEGHYEIDFEDFENKIAEHQVKLFLLCSPQNPTGRVWKEWELQKLGGICLRHGVLVVSDEIHSDFVWEENRHHVFASLSPDFEKIAVTCTAPSKTFNLAGLQISNIFIADPELKKSFCNELSAIGYGEVNMLGLEACRAAYEEGGDWLKELKQYIWGNYLFLEEYLEKRIPKLHAVRPEGTYLVWVDFRDLGLSAEEREKLIVEKARLWLNEGGIFGKEGEGFERINIACPRAVLKQALEQLEDAVTSVKKD